MLCTSLLERAALWHLQVDLEERLEQAPQAVGANRISYMIWKNKTS